jgi:hypothetical protein
MHLDRIQLIQQFLKSPDETLFDQKTVAAITGKSLSWCEKMRWLGGGIPFKKMGINCLYHKRDIIRWVEEHQLFHSTSEYQNKNDKETQM